MCLVEDPMFRNVCECFTGILTHLDKMQSQKDFGNVMSHIPDDLYVRVHTIDVLRQIQNSQLKDNAWVGGDAWFGSVHTAVSAVKCFGVHL